MSKVGHTVCCNFHLQRTQSTQGVGGLIENLHVKTDKHNPRSIKMSISSVDLSRTARMWLFPTEALLVRLAVAVFGFNDGYVVADPHFQVLGLQGSSVELLQKVRHTCQVPRERHRHEMYAAGE